MPPEKSDLEERQRRFYLHYAGLGLEFAGGITGFVLLGWAVDYWLGSSPIGTIAGSVLGFAGGLYNLIRRAKEIQAGIARMERDKAARNQGSDDERSP